MSTQRRFKIYKNYTEQDSYPVANVCGSFAKGIVFDAEDNKYKFLKIGSPKFEDDLGTQYGEFYCSQILRALGFKKNIVGTQESSKTGGLTYVEYDLIELRGSIFTLADLYTAKNKIFKPFEAFLDVPLRREGVDLEILKANQKTLIKHFGKDNFEDLMVFDALVYNTDRHFRNIEIEIDSDTNQPIGPGPIYDNGLSFFGYLRRRDLNDIEGALKDTTSAFQIDFDEQLKIFVQPRHAEIYAKLLDFRFDRTHPLGLADDELERIEQFIQRRAKKIIEIAKEKALKYGKTESLPAEDSTTDSSKKQKVGYLERIFNERMSGQLDPQRSQRFSTS